MIANPEALALEARIAEAEEAFDIELDEWARQAVPIHKRIVAAEEWAHLSGDWKPLHVARADLRVLGDAPVEPLSLSMLRGRLARLEQVA